MSPKMKDGLMVAGGWVLIVGFVLIVIYVLPMIESWYEFIGEKIPVLGRLIDWANGIVR